jgi:cation diffusion facilitator family transporter
MASSKSITKTRALQLSFVAIASVVVFEGIVGLITNSLAILSDAAHALFDTTTTLILLVTTQLSMNPPDEEHLYGHGKIEPIGGLIGGIALVVLAAFLSYQAATRILFFNPSDQVVHLEVIGFGAVGYTLAVDLFRIGTLRRTEAGSATVTANFYHAVSDFASTVIALIGFGLAFFRVFDARIDAAASIVLSALLIYLTSGLIRTSSAELSDQIPKGIVAEIRKEIMNTKSVQTCKELRTRRVGSKTFVETTICVPNTMGLAEAHDIASQIENNITHLYGDSSVTVHIEPVAAEKPIEKHIEGLATAVNGVKGIHDLTSVYSEGKMYVTMHALVDPQLPLEHAHKIAERIEASLAGRFSSIESVTVHIEPYSPTARREFAAEDADMQRMIRQIAESHPDIKRVRKVVTYVSAGKRYINVDCFFDKGISVESMHDTISHVEADIKNKFRGAIVTTHAEPSP